ncbi:MAG: hypothetical protein V7785_00120 [Bermanella sp.]
MDISFIVGMFGSVASVFAVFLITKFLQQGRVESSLTRKEVEFLKEELREAQKFTDSRPKDVINLINSLQSEVSSIRNELTHLNDEDRLEIVHGLKESLTTSSAKDVLESIKKEVSEELDKNFKNSAIEANFENTISRLREELYSLTKRGNLNLAIGIVTTIVGLTLLGIFVLSAPISFKEPIDFIESFVPRFSLVVFIEIFAYFFLRLYKDTLAEIKYFQNEITNVESKHLAVALAINNSSEEGVLNSIENLVKTERNHILEKGQTTVEIEKARTEQQLTNSVMDKLGSVFSKSPNK